MADSTSWAGYIKGEPEQFCHTKARKQRLLSNNKMT